MILRARTVVPMTGPPIDNGAVVIKGNRIRAVGTLPEVAALFTGVLVDLGEQVLMPGLINAHCHLDYTMLRRAISPPSGFTTWVQRLNAVKRSLRDEDYLEAIAHGFAELVKWGTTSVLNIESFPELMSRIPTPPIRTWWFYEMIDVRQRITTEDLLDGASIFFRKHAEWTGGFGLSPHAPYTASPDLYQLANECARQDGLLLTTHLAESAEEAAMFERASGPLYDFLQSLGRDMSDCGHGSSVRHLLGWGLIGPEWIVAHMNELEDSDFDLLEKTPVHVVHCPASHRYFRHRPFPLERLRKIGINLSLGTDSLASSNSLSLFDEMRAVCDTQPSVSPREAVEMVTLNPALALRKPRDLGCLYPKARADLIALPIAPKTESLFEEIVDYRKRVEWVMVNGQLLQANQALFPQS
jgi:cytosine/adenosine deaminase-related metal-dependent hydrolase